MEFVKACLSAMIPKKHPLMVIDREISFAFASADFKKYDSQSDEGHPPIDPEVPFRIVFVAHLEGLSYREVVGRLQHDVLYRAFTGWWEAGHPHHGTLSRFLERVGSEPVAQALNKVVVQARKGGIITDRLIPPLLKAMPTSTGCGPRAAARTRRRRGRRSGESRITGSRLTRPVTWTRKR